MPEYGQRIAAASLPVTVRHIQDSCDFYMLYWSTRGTGHQVIDYRSYEMPPGRLFFIPAGSVHQVSKYPEEGWLVLLDASVIRQFRAQHPGLLLNALAEPYTDLAPGLLQRFNSTAVLMEQETCPAAMCYYAFALLAQTGLSLNGAKPFTMEQQLWEKLLQLIGQNYKTEKHTGFYSKTLGTSARKLNELTKLASGKLVMQLVGERTLTESEWLLLHTDMPVKNIAYELGFFDQAHFAGFFLKHKGLSPTAFRQQDANK